MHPDSIDLMLRRFYERKARRAATEAAMRESCKACKRGEKFAPTHDGSPNCESGSIASGGNRPHCTCDWCF